MCILFSISGSYCFLVYLFFFFKQKTAYEMRISDWSSDVCSSDLDPSVGAAASGPAGRVVQALTTPTGGVPLRVENDRARLPVRCDAEEIGRASCRERVCQYV